MTLVRWEVCHGRKMCAFGVTCVQSRCKGQEEERSGPAIGRAVCTSCGELAVSTSSCGKLRQRALMGSLEITPHPKGGQRRGEKGRKGNGPDRESVKRWELDLNRIDREIKLK